MNNRHDEDYIYNLDDDDLDEIAVREILGYEMHFGPLHRPTRSHDTFKRVLDKLEERGYLEVYGGRIYASFGIPKLYNPPLRDCVIAAIKTVRSMDFKGGINGDECNHEKVYSNRILSSASPLRPWICRKCGLRGAEVAQFPLVDDGSEYADLVRKFDSKR